MKHLAKALSMAAQAFEKKLDMGGNPYFLHCIRVMNDCGSTDENVLCAAVLHDFIEDVEDGRKKLVRAKFPEAVIDLIAILTHLDDETYDEYIKRVSCYPEATKIKLADLRDNSNITRLKGLRKKDFDRLEKYHRSYVYLSSVVY